MKKFLLLLFLPLIILTACTNTSKVFEKYPEYKDLGAKHFKGLEIYVCSLAENHFEFRITEGTNRNKTFEELLQTKPLSSEELLKILEYNHVPKDEVLIIPWINPASSYLYEVNDAYVENVKKLLHNKYNVSEYSPQMLDLDLSTQDVNSKEAKEK